MFAPNSSTHIMRILTNLLFISASLISAAGSAYAGATASHNQYCEVTDPFTGASSITMVEGRCTNGRPVGDRVIVQAGADSEDAGKPGAIYIGLLRDGSIHGQFIATGMYSNSSSWGVPKPSISAKSGEWVPFEGGLFRPSETYAALPPQLQNYVLIDGPLMCTQTSGGNLELWVGYGALDQQEIELLKNMKAVVSRGMTEEHLMLTRIQNDMRKKERGWKVLQIPCPAPDFGF